MSVYSFLSCRMNFRRICKWISKIFPSPNNQLYWMVELQNGYRMLANRWGGFVFIFLSPLPIRFSLGIWYADRSTCVVIRETLQIIYSSMSIPELYEYLTVSEIVLNLRNFADCVKCLVLCCKFHEYANGKQLQVMRKYLDLWSI